MFYKAQSIQEFLNAFFMNLKFLILFSSLNFHTPIVTVAQLFFLENSFQKHKILTSLEAILERFIF